MQLVSVGIASEHDPLWTILISRVVVVAVFGVAALVTRPAFREGAPRGLLVIGALDAGANVCFAFATTTGPARHRLGDRLDVPGDHRRRSRTGASASGSAAPSGPAS